MMDRKKILPEDLLQRTNLQQHNFMIDAINEVDERQGIVEDITAVNTADVATLKDDLITLSNEHNDDIAALSNEHREDFIVLSNEKLDKASVNMDLHFGEITLTREGTSVIASLDVLNPVTGLITPISFTIPGATPSMAGVMPADDAAWIAEAEVRISALEGMSDVKAIVGLPEDPTQAEITGAWMSETSRAPATGDLAQDVSNGKLWIFVDDRWVLHGVVVTVPVATTTSLGGVKDTALGAPANRWYCHVEADGRVALIGGDSLSTLLDTTIPAMQGELALKADKTEVDNKLALKADKTEVNNALALKADKTEVALKADKTEVALKADKTEVALKADKTDLAGLVREQIIKLDPWVGTSEINFTVYEDDYFRLVCRFSPTTKSYFIVIYNTSSVYLMWQSLTTGTGSLQEKHELKIQGWKGSISVGSDAVMMNYNAVSNTNKIFSFIGIVETLVGVTPNMRKLVEFKWVGYPFGSNPATADKPDVVLLKVTDIN